MIFLIHKYILIATSVSKFCILYFAANIYVKIYVIHTLSSPQSISSWYNYHFVVFCLGILKFYTLYLSLHVYSIYFNANQQKASTQV